MQKVFLDSCVILSRIPRELFIDSARLGLLSLYYSQSVEEECIHVARRKAMEEDIFAAFVTLKLVGEKVQGEENLGIFLPDENDVHVLEGAITAKVDILATENLRDFPKAALQDYKMIAKNPDQILLPILEKRPEILENYSRKSLKASKLYRLAKLVD